MVWGWAVGAELQQPQAPPTKAPRLGAGGEGGRLSTEDEEDEQVGEASDHGCPGGGVSQNGLQRQSWSLWQAEECAAPPSNISVLLPGT